MNATYRVLIADQLSPRAEEILRAEKDFEVINRPGIPREELLRAVPEMDALLVRSATQVDDAVLGAGERLKVVARAGIGVDNVDLDGASRRGILVVNAPDGNVITTAEHTMALLFALARKVPAAVSSVKSGKWERNRFVGSELHAKTLGVVGLGRIGSTVAQLARGIGMNLIAYDPYISADAAAKRGVKLVSFDEVLAQSDYITLHVPKTSETESLIGAEAIAKMKKGVRIINCARGGLVDEAALAAALDTGKVAGAAMDVYSTEPPQADHPLVGRENVVCTPHLGASTAEAQENVAISAADQVVAFLTKGVVRHAVNLPALGPDVLEQIGPYLQLADRLGHFLAQLVEGGVKRLEVIYGGRQDVPIGPLSASALKGFLGKFLSGARVNLVNGPLLAKERGIEVVASTRSETEKYTNLIELKAATSEGERSVAGTIVGEEEPRIVQIDHFGVDVTPEGYKLVFTNEDRPGMIGAIGTLLGSHKINIAGMQLGRTKRSARAVAVLALDDPIPDEVMEKIRSIPNIYDAKLVRL
ncbi:MAG: phosphoglycerate dehydrogenase [Candidatus Tectomicrobia bacterium RIFCSPLOWO2_12_FULL_69_37]|nr:MAG: phosphoglycerate dehydrogenase [Candidatus Tectomicrobia bacterium RIFCSPLOWO2_02_FULL_70_19]OGL69387.1 MAG: phosphoglycerate dehydrogenase [Candidatus Tectomicrobia bacterium RIFCSPLOWO2_12_FULL_69_37]